MRYAIGEHQHMVPVTPQMIGGAPYEVAIQVFPDGTCGFAVDGVPVARTEETIALDRPFRVVASGNSVRTRILVGPLRIWQGINPEYDWAVLDVGSGAESRR